ncbi:YbaK/EbsC family protein [Rhodococcus sp. IEGM 1401]|jgi:prolyl-tRNA editing enzyme YbaK/EbsC (Cys-tRNA(Pro) deacylase)|uniref:YbaK/EbsC family protein n=2 Tax=Rhodococcus TaxID=1827 RepID=A0ABU4B5S9_9NOCA|nr:MULTISPECIES: YbaK/EbsC family protein [Rhodococcus]KAA0924982.1 YbaK/EbsC family protein [Rhodococcus sp. ANT_H53B]KZE99746.1 EbsC protein [Rhodococcus sp. EPR-147]KZF00577.1 EbsC protein [Rhodococcus sp. EPR-279]MCZ4562831.1 YbaK/EbsC family protein [Rhodococcus sp. IEGM 1401]MDI6628774.1 YbaK/EbsC family protein [Rhodococcus sp. (in: high G+C Gram-positive bacteria)]
MSRLLHPNAAHVADTLISRGHHGVVVSSPEGTHTAADAAAALGVDVGAIVKSMVFLLGDEPVLLLVSGAHNVHLEHTGERLGGVLTRAPLDTAKHATGQPIGGIAPVGHPTNLDTFVDQDLAGYSEVWAAAGHTNTIFRSTFTELVRITAGLAIDVT